METAHVETEAPADRPRHPWRELALLALLSLTLHLVGNGRTSLWDRDEPRYAGATREMWQSGDLTFPTFNAEPRFHKPILIYWLMMIGTAIGGEDPFGARLVSAFAGMATVLAVWGFGRRLFGPSAGRWAALILATAPIFVAESKLATTDASLMLSLLGTQFAIWQLAHDHRSRWTAMFWSCLAVAFLIKGPAGPALLFAASAASWLLGAPREGYLRLITPLIPSWKGLDERRRLASAWRTPGSARIPRTAVALAGLSGALLGRWLTANWGLFLFAAIAAPWFIIIGIRSHGEFYNVAMGYHVLRRATQGIETHGGFPGYYVALSIALFYPWSAFLPAGLVAAWKRRREQPALAFVLGWIIGPLVLLEIVRTKLIHYYLPAYPACALLVGWLVPLVAKSDVNLRRWPLGRLSVGLLAGIGLTYSVGLLAGVFVFPGQLKWHCLPLAVLLAGGTLYALDRLQRGHTQRAVGSLVGVWGVALFLLGGYFLPDVQPYRLTPKVAARLSQLEHETGARAVLTAFKPPGVVYEIGHPVPHLGNKQDLLDRLATDGAIAAALNDVELAKISSFPEVVVQPDPTPLSGLNVETFRIESLRPVVVRLRSDAVATGGQPSRVK